MAHNIMRIAKILCRITYIHMSNYLRSFVIGSSLPVFFLFFYKVAHISNTIKNYPYTQYSLIAPLYFGIMNAISLFIATRYSLTLRQRLLLIGAISPIIVISLAKIINSYNFTNEEWIRYAIRVIIKHILVFNVIIYALEKNV